MFYFKRPFWEQKKIIISFKKKFLKKKFYQRLVRNIYFFKSNQKLLKGNFQFKKVIKYLCIWTKWFNKLYIYKKFLSFLYYSYRQLTLQFKLFIKFSNLKKYFIKYSNINYEKKKFRSLQPDVLKISSFFLISNYRKNNIDIKINEIISYFYFLKSFFKLYVIFIFFWWYINFSLTFFFLKKFLQVKINFYNIFFPLPIFTIEENRYFKECNFIIYNQIYLLLL